MSYVVLHCPQERNSIPVVPVYSLVRDATQETATEESRDTQTTPPPNKPEDAGQEAPFTLVRLDSMPVTQTQPPGTTEGQADSPNGGLLSFFKKGKGDQPQEGRAGPAWLQNAPQGTSVDQDSAHVRSAQEENSDSPLAKLTRMVKSFGHTPSLDLADQPVQEGVFRGPKHVGDDPEDNDESSGYEDAQSDLQEQETLPGASTPDGSPDGGFLEEEMGDEEDGDTAAKTGEPGSPKPNDSCVLS